MSAQEKKKTIVIGHKNPDTDSICSAICYADFKHRKDKGEYIPARAGELNPETEFVLSHFGVPVPELVENVKTQIRDIEINPIQGIAGNVSLKQAFDIMQEHNTVTLPVLAEDKELLGVITVGDITRAYMNEPDASIVSQAKTQYSNIVETLKGEMIVGDPARYFEQGKVLIAAANPDMMESYIDKGDLVILGNRYESQLCAIEMEADCIVVSGGAPVSLTIRKLAQEKGCSIITTPMDTYTVARLMNQSMPVSYFMRSTGLVTFDDEDYLDDIKDIMASRRVRYFPVLDKNGLYRGMMSRRNLLGAAGKNVILVDHNERSQCVEGITNANILEIIDHHRLRSVETLQPVFFRNQPLGCTATIIYQMYREERIPIPETIAGLLLSAIISDTLLFRSPTCTAADCDAAKKLEKIAGIEAEDLANRMFSAGSDLAGKTEEEILYRDFKRFKAGKVNFAVGQITSVNSRDLEELEGRMVPFLEKAVKMDSADMMFLMLTNILTESTRLVCAGPGAVETARAAFLPEENPEDGAGEPAAGQVITIPGMVSRKKQLIPNLVQTIG